MIQRHEKFEMQAHSALQRGCLPGTPLCRVLLIGLFCLFPAVSGFAAEGPTHSDPVAPVLLALIVLLAAAKLGGELLERAGLPAVLGELLAGVFLGNLILVHSGWTFFEPLRAVPVQESWAIAIDILARLGVIVLLFEVGLASTVREMMRVGASSLMVAMLGVIAPFLLGSGVSWLFIQEIPPGLRNLVPPNFSIGYIHLFVGAVLCATSVGITARVFRDLGKLQTKEAQIILGAAVIDDVLGLVVLAVVSAMVRSAEFGRPLEIGAVFRLTGISILFLGSALVLGAFLLPRMMRQLARMKTSGIMLVSALLFAFAMSYMADAAGLAAIVGAFAAGLLLEEAHFQGFAETLGIQQLVRPMSTFLVPFFFVLMGIQVRLETFADPKVLGIAAGLTLVAAIGKQVCGLGILEKGIDRLTVGVGMIPRGEVGLIFAGIGKGLKVVDDAIFSAIVIMIMATTLITPPLVKWTLARQERQARSLR